MLKTMMLLQVKVVTISQGILSNNITKDLSIYLQELDNQY